VSSWFGDEDAERRREMDRRTSGQHKGKGPKGYSRSDDRIKEDINDRLSDDVFVDASEIEVTVAQGEVTLTGTVGTRSEKRRAEDLAEEVSGVKNVENRLRLASTISTQGRSQDSSWGSSGTTDSATSETTSGRAKTKQTY
jgi:osmotically-inducible protein OsmY